MIVIDEMGWFRFDTQLKGNWINWANPQFIGYEGDWKPLLLLQKGESDLPNGLGATIHEIDSVKIFRQNAAFEFRLEKEVSLR